MSPATNHLIETIISAVVAVITTLGAKKGFDKTIKRKTPPMDEGTKQLIIELRKQLTEVKRDLAKERRERQAAEVRHQQQLDRLNSELSEARTRIAVLTNARAQRVPGEPVPEGEDA